MTVSRAAAIGVLKRRRRLLEAEGIPFRGARVAMDVAWVPAPPRE